MIQAIDRLDDPRVREYRHVGDAAWLRANGIFVAEGRLVVQRLLDARRFRVRSIFLTPAALEALSPPAELDVFVAGQPLLDTITGFNFHRGCLALGERPPLRAVPALVAQAATAPAGMARTRLLALEGVGNPDNVGGLFRVAAAFGVGGVLLDPATGDPLYRKAVRTSMGAALAVPFARAEEWPAALHHLRAEGFTLLALTPRPDALSLPELAVRGRHGRVCGTPLALLLGAEGSGLSAGALEAADLLVRIPMASGVDSLNVTVAAGIALSHLA